MNDHRGILSSTVVLGNRELSTNFITTPSPFLCELPLQQERRAAAEEEEQAGIKLAATWENHSQLP